MWNFFQKLVIIYFGVWFWKKKEGKIDLRDKRIFEKVYLNVFFIKDRQIGLCGVVFWLEYLYFWGFE